MPTRICLIHAVQVAIAPVEDAFARLWPEAERMNLLEDRLSVDRAKEGRITDDMQRRFDDLSNYAVAAGAQGILFTCSAFGPAIERVGERLSIPVLKPNEAMFTQALKLGTRIGLIATFAPSIGSMAEEFNAMAAAQGSKAELVTACVPRAMDELNAGRVEHHHALVAGAVKELGACEAILLAQFSMAGARQAVEQATSVPVLTSPDSAVQAMRAAIACGKA